MDNKNNLDRYLFDLLTSSFYVFKGPPGLPGIKGPKGEKVSGLSHPAELNFLICSFFLFHKRISLT